jgi:hypothetical protein
MWQRRWVLLMRDPWLIPEDTTDGSRTRRQETTVRQAGDPAGRAQGGRSRARRLQGNRRQWTRRRRQLQAPDCLQQSRFVAECISGSAGSIQLAPRTSLNLVLNPATARFAVGPRLRRRIEAHRAIVDDVAGDLTRFRRAVAAVPAPRRIPLQFFLTVRNRSRKTVRRNSDFTRGDVCLNRAHFAAGGACRSPIPARRTADDQPARAGPGPEVHGCG